MDLLATTETSLAPLYDFSLAGIGTYNLLDGFLTLGAGVNFKRLISVDKEKTSRKTRVNGYIEHNSVYYSTFAVQEQAAKGKILPASIPAGPNNPLGKYVIQLDIPGYFIHGTNKSSSIGRSIS